MSKKHRGRFKGDPVTYQLPSPAGGVRLETFVPWTLVKRGIKKQVITPIDAPQQFLLEAAKEREARAEAQDTPLIRALGLAYHWQRLLHEGRFRSMTEIVAVEGLDAGRASRIARLAHLAPDIVESCLVPDSGGIALEHLIRQGTLPLKWETQRQWLTGGSRSSALHKPDNRR